MYLPTFATKILLVDDQLSSLIAIEQILEGLDTKILKATSGKEALMIMLKESVDCILLDVSMPDMDGFEFLNTLRSAPAHANIPVIMVTGKIFSENESLRAYQHGAVDYLLKPLDSEIVYRKVSFIVRQAERIRAIESMAAIMKNFNSDVLAPLKRLRKTGGTHSDASKSECIPSKMIMSKNSLPSDAQTAGSAHDQELNRAFDNLNQLHNLWEAFDDSKPLF